MADEGFLLPEGAVSRLYRMLSWFEHGRQPDRSLAGQLPQIIPHQFRRFKLTEVLVAYGTSDAHWLKWDESVSALVEDSENFPVTDVQGFAADSGAVGIAWKPHDRPEWEVVSGSLIASASGVARWVYFSLDDDLATDDSDVSGTVLDYYDGSDPGATITLINMLTSDEVTYLFYGTEGARGLACCSSVGVYRIVQLECS